MFSLFNSSIGLDLVTLGIAIITIAILGLLVYLNNRRDIVNKTFLFFVLLTIAYGVTNYFNYQFAQTAAAIWTIRLTIFFAVWHAFSAFQFFYVFRNPQPSFPYWYTRILLPVVVIVSLLTLTPFVFSTVQGQVPVGELAKIQTGPIILIFLALVIYLVLGGIYMLIRRTVRAEGIAKTQLKFILIGTLITFISLILFNLILPTVFSTVVLVPLAPVFILPFIIFTSYSILRYHLFNVRVIATQIFVFVLWIFILVRTLLSTQLSEQMLNGGLLLLTIVVGILLMRSVIQEVKTREKIQKQEEALTRANGRLKELDQLKSEFVSLAT
ncbi:MAG: hypothetical protein NUV54_00230, partial [Candidatus Taylorbacteria bacterium]|nr:hypothetical protein [Candidatus Taylorbacteria bacterium]